MTTKTRRIYDLFQGPRGPSCESKWYAHYSKRTWQVVAVSIKQAVFLAAKDVWYDGNTGIVGYDNGNRDSARSHRYYDGSTGNAPRWKHYQVWKE